MRYQVCRGSRTTARVYFGVTGNQLNRVIFKYLGLYPEPRGDDIIQGRQMSCTNASNCCFPFLDPAYTSITASGLPPILLTEKL